MEATRHRRRVRVLVAAALLLALGAACGDGGETATLTGIVRAPAPDVGAVTLPDASRGGAPLRMAGPAGGLLVVYFGYTSCPDVCPTTMADLRSALGTLADEERARVDVAMVTIDPERDNGDLLTGYVQTFVPGGHALRTDDPAELRAAADAFGADYSVVDRGTGSPEVSHTPWVYAVDDRGALRVQWSFGTAASDIAHDLHLLLAGTGGQADDEETSP